jgi:hypothetical protein
MVEEGMAREVVSSRTRGLKERSAVWPEKAVRTGCGVEMEASLHQ